jgi:2-methylcitrate dehydratase PrpD
LSSTRNYAAITGELGKSYEIALNTYKPFACGIVIHPTIDACIQLRNEHRLTADAIDRIDLRVHPLVLELTGKKTPATGLESKFSVYFAAALAIVVGSAGVSDFSDANAANPILVSLRDRVTATVDPMVKEEQGRATIILKDGRRLEKFVEHVVGSLERPMSDADLEAKFLGLAKDVLGERQARTLIGRCWDIEKLPSAADLAAAARPV